MIRKGFLALFIGGLLLAGCGNLAALETPSPEPITVAERKTSALTPEGSGGEVPVDGAITATAPLGLIEIATQTAQAVLTAEGGSQTVPPVDSGLATSTVSIQVNPTATDGVAPAATTGGQLQPSATPNPSDTNPPAASNTPAPQNTPTKTAAPSATHTTAPPANCAPNSDSAFENEVVSLINAERSKAGLSPLAKQSQLTAAARIHSQDMACNDFFDHNSPTTGTPFDRITAQGYTFSFAGENIAAGYGTAAAVVNGWMNSAGHRANILNENFTQIGVGYAYTTTSTYGSYVTAVFAKP